MVLRLSNQLEMLGFDELCVGQRQMPRQMPNAGVWCGALRLRTN